MGACITKPTVTKRGLLWSTLGKHGQKGAVLLWSAFLLRKDTSWRRSSQCTSFAVSATPTWGSLSKGDSPPINLLH